MTTTIDKYQSEYDFLYFIRMKEDNKKHWSNQKEKEEQKNNDEVKQILDSEDDEKFVYF
ncbi:hypothetical protein HZA96_05650 [Candidatus Woesearchaeota archaeon]|nr:hypothetical protein [Candidatus Woesearchaeota archaeon]